MRQQGDEKQWEELLSALQQRFEKKPDMNAVLFLIGVHELGKGKKNFSKEEKRDLMHIAVCKVLSLSGYYKLEGIDADGWPHWKPSEKLPPLNLKEQEALLKQHIIEYFKKEVLN